MNDTNKIVVPVSIVQCEEALRMPIGEAFRMWDVTNRKVYMKLVVSKLEDHGTTRNYMPKDIKIRRGYSKTDTRDVHFTPTWD